jgi:hypothetical protein
MNGFGGIQPKKLAPYNGFNFETAVADTFMFCYIQP